MRSSEIFLRSDEQGTRFKTVICEGLYGGFELAAQWRPIIVLRCQRRIIANRVVALSDSGAMSLTRGAGCCRVGDFR
jgi:hypothetical protein